MSKADGLRHFPNHLNDLARIFLKKGWNYDVFIRGFRHLTAEKRDSESLKINRGTVRVNGHVYKGNDTPYGRKEGFYEPYGIFKRLVFGTVPWNVATSWSHYVGEVHHDARPHGTGALINSDGTNYYDGEWEEGIIKDQGTLTWPNGERYVGQFNYDVPHGEGTLTFPDGDKYEGEYQNGKKHGQGTYHIDDGKKYVGAWKDDKRHGRGTYTSSKGKKFEGEWKYDQLIAINEGEGTLTYPNGDKYNGKWKDGKRQGHGTCTYADGREYDGGWDKGIPHGYGWIDKYNGKTFSHSFEYKGLIPSGLVWGKGTLYIDGVKRYAGTFANGKAEGHGVMNYLDGSKYAGLWENGERHDPNGAMSFLGNSSSMKGRWFQGQRLPLDLDGDTIVNIYTNPPPSTTDLDLMTFSDHRECNDLWAALQLPL